MSIGVHHPRRCGRLRRLPIELASLAFLTVVSAPPCAAAPTIKDAKLASLSERLFPMLNRMTANDGFAAVRSVLYQRHLRYLACIDDPCRIDALQWTDQEIGTVEDAASKLMPGPDHDTRAAVHRELIGLNGVLRVYGAGAVPHYSEVDGPDGRGTVPFASDVSAALASAQELAAEQTALLDPSVAAVLTLLDGSNRLDAIAFEPLDRENSAAMAKARSVQWDRFPYTAIILLGVGPEQEGIPLSPLSKLNIHLAATRFREGMAPFIIVSGGAVHPRRTPFVEAIEMRKALIERYAVPPEAIVIEPYARHTTTNLRNAARLLVALRAPIKRPALIVTNPLHASMVASKSFVERCLAELGYEPGSVGRPLSPTELPFLYDGKSLRVDPADPLDP